MKVILIFIALKLIEAAIFVFLPYFVGLAEHYFVGIIRFYEDDFILTWLNGFLCILSPWAIFMIGRVIVAENMELAKKLCKKRS